MTRISVFNHLSLDGFFSRPNGEMDWFKQIQKDQKYEDYIQQQSKSGDTLIFGRTTYEIMKNYWPTKHAIDNSPDMARVINNSPKIVFQKRSIPSRKVPIGKMCDSCET